MTSRSLIKLFRTMHVDALYIPGFVASNDGAVVTTLQNGVTDTGLGNATAPAPANGFVFKQNGFNGRPCLCGTANSRLVVPDGLKSQSFQGGFSVFVAFNSQNSTANNAITLFSSGNNSEFSLTRDSASAPLIFNHGAMTPTYSQISVSDSQGVAGFIYENRDNNKRLRPSYGRRRSGAMNGTPQTAGNFVLGGPLTIGALANGDDQSAFDGDLGVIAIWNRPLSEREEGIVLDALHAYHRIQSALKPLLICCGNELMISTGGTSPSRLSDRLGDGWEVRQDAYAGRTIGQMLGEASLSLDWRLWRDTTARQILLFWEGSNDIKNMLQFDSPSAPEAANRAFEKTRAWCEGRRGKGAQIVVTTAIARSDAGLPADWQAATDAYNALLRAGYREFADGICDLAGDQRFANSANATYFAPDLFNLSQAGKDVVSDLMLDAVLTLAVPGHSSVTNNKIIARLVRDEMDAYSSRLASIDLRTRDIEQVASL